MQSPDGEYPENQNNWLTRGQEFSTNPITQLTTRPVGAAHVLYPE
jgi:hypothetical protein